MMNPMQSQHAWVSSVDKQSAKCGAVPWKHFQCETGPVCLVDLLDPWSAMFAIKVGDECVQSLTEKQL